MTKKQLLLRIEMIERRHAKEDGLSDPGLSCPNSDCHADDASYRSSCDLCNDTGRYYPDEY